MKNATSNPDDHRPVAIYTRVSTARQGAEGVSLEAQDKTCRILADLHFPGAEIRAFRDVASGRTDKRAGYQELMEGVRRGRFRAVIAWSHDRICRCSGDFSAFLGALERSSTHVILHALGVCSLSPAGRLVLQILAATAEFESGSIGERVRATHEHTFAKGIKGPGLRPFGWKPNAENILEADVDEQRVIDLAAHLRSRNQTWAEVADACNELGVFGVDGKPWYSQKIQSVLVAALRRRGRLAELHRANSGASPGTQPATPATAPGTRPGASKEGTRSPAARAAAGMPGT